ncbi:hypothetical protein GCK32_004177 [Trichostrongylus colubriformis]|uniref:Uncharacterized protein n=1 Tax=Trichostrongylus colubriformis TaxID=6319 RepID=A0AAN8G457_TRICO
MGAERKALKLSRQAEQYQIALPKLLPDCGCHVATSHAIMGVSASVKSSASVFRDGCSKYSTARVGGTTATEGSSAEMQDESFEREELDYDEDDDEEHKEERTGRFTSERSQTNSTPPSTNTISKVESRRHGVDNRNQHQGQKQWQNNGGRGGNNRGARGNGQRFGRGGPLQQNGRNMRGSNGPPSLLMGVTNPPPLLTLNTQGIHGPPPGGKILINPNFRGPMGPPGTGALGPPSILPPVGSRPSILPSIVPGQSGPIIPRLPNGIPLTGLPSNHGAAGFGPPVQQPPPSTRPPMPPPIIPGMSAIISRPAPVVQWDQAVEEFLSGSTSQRQRSPRRRHRRSSSYSSYSSYSSRSRSAGSSRSRSPRRRRDNRGSGGGSSRPRGQRDRNGRGGGYARGRGGQNRRDNAPRRETKDHKQISVECAKAVGLDNDYLSKLEDQRRKRDEVLRRKEQRRFGANQQESSSNGRSNDRPNDRGRPDRQNQQRDRRPNEGSSSSNDHRRSGGGSGSTSQSTSRPSTEAEAALKKNKAYLCVNVKNIKQLTTAKMRVETLAKDLGEIRKCWKSNEDQVTVIFVEHAKAKEFMLKYNNKVLSGLRIQVSLEKAYLNLSEIQ